ncbi:MAG TPA: hypothetical protein VGN72_06615 [Tepidisphaeraceae bacterium]|nr:hypothetical protein [Tepidisphaeraceae bacterium]
MRATDRTLIANLGFADPDKADGLHDRICQYLMTPDVATQVAAMIPAHAPVTVRSVARATEVPLTKGQGSYKQTIGFLDVLYKIFFQSSSGSFDQELIIEVKSRATSVGAMLRQVNLYREYWQGYGRPAFMLATAFDLTDADMSQLAASKILHVRIGERFNEWSERQDRMATVARMNEV